MVTVALAIATDLGSGDLQRGRPISGIDGKRFRSIPHTGELRGGHGG
jgi:hypothetical protein